MRLRRVGPNAFVNDDLAASNLQHSNRVQAYVISEEDLLNELGFIPKFTDEDITYVEGELSIRGCFTYKDIIKSVYYNPSNLTWAFYVYNPDLPSGGTTVKVLTF